MYSNLLTNITGKDRADLMKVFDDDARFDLWLEAFNNKMSSEGDKTADGKVRIGQQEYVQRFAKVYGEEE